ncbi:MAG: H-X9-DG-CTERM domain-containing protein [Planctomycetota bacterium]
MFFDMMLLYDMILENMDMCDIDDDVEQQIAEVEKMIGVKIQDELLDSLEGTFMGYLLPAYSSPELLAPGYVITARLDDVDQFKKCMTSLEAYVKSIVPAGQLQITSQVTEDDKVVHIWAISFAAMMQVIPAWAIEDDMLVIATHPNIVKKVVQRIDGGAGETLISRPEFANALGLIPDDTFAMNLTDSKAQARQLMSMLQQYWPMLNMGLASEGIQLPIMLPSIEKYIEQMEPGYSYIQKAPDRIAFHYEGTGLEATSGGIAGGAAGLAILMPALSRTKRIAERVVCGTNLKGLATALIVYANDYDDILPSENWCDVLIEEVDVSPKSFVCPQSDAIEGECSYAMNENVVGKNMGKFPADVVLVFETDKGREDGPRNASIKTRKHYGFLGNYYDEDTMVYKGRFNQTGGSEDVVCHHNNSGQQGCNIMFADGHVEFVTKDRIANGPWNNRNSNVGN